MNFLDSKTKNEISKQEIKDAVEKSGEWKGVSYEYPGGIVYDYRISKGDGMYTSEVFEGIGQGRGIRMQASYPNFDPCFLSLEALQSCIVHYWNLGKK